MMMMMMMVVVVMMIIIMMMITIIIITTIVFIMMILRTIINHHQLCHPAAAPRNPWSQRSRLCESSSASHCEGWRICVPPWRTVDFWDLLSYMAYWFLWLDMLDMLDMAYNPDPKWDAHPSVLLKKTLVKLWLVCRGPHDSNRLSFESYWSGEV